MKKYIEILFSIVKITKTPYYQIINLGIFSLLASLIEILALIQLKNFISILDLKSFYKTENLSDLFIPSILLISIYFLRLIISVFVNYKIFYRSNQMMISLRGNLTKKLLECKRGNLNLSQNNNNINLLQNQSINVSNVFVGQAVKAISELLIILIILTYLALEDTLVVFISLIFIFLGYLIIQGPLKRISSRIGLKNINAMENTLSSYSNIFNNYKMIRSLGKDFYFRNRINKYLKIYASSSTIDKTIKSLPRVVFEFCLILGAIFSLLVLSLISEDFTNTIASVSLIIAGGFRIVPGANIISGFINATSFNFESYKKVMNLYRSTNEKCSYNNLTRSSKSNIYKYKINNLKFGRILDRKDKVLCFEDQLKFEYGRINAISGPSGAGKTTLLESLMGFRGEKYLPDFKINDIVIAPKDREEIISSCAYCPQIPTLLDATLSENISLDDHNVKPFDKERADSILNDLDLIEIKQNIDWDTNLTSSNYNLSVGQIQRISLARAIYASKKVLFLDEITSSLDFKNELSIIKLLNKLSKEILIVWVTHSDLVLSKSNVVFSF